MVVVGPPGVVNCSKLFCHDMRDGEHGRVGPPGVVAVGLVQAVKQRDGLRLRVPDTNEHCKQKVESSFKKTDNYLQSFYEYKKFIFSCAHTTHLQRTGPSSSPL